MRFFVPLALFGAAAYASSLEDAFNSMPDCAKSCVDDFFSGIGCSAGDASCLCGKQDEVLSASTDMASCLSQNCDSQTLMDWTQNSNVDLSSLQDAASSSGCDSSSGSSSGSSDDSSGGSSASSQDPAGGAANALSASTAILAAGALTFLAAL